MNFYDIYFWKLFSKLVVTDFRGPPPIHQDPRGEHPRTASGTNRFPTDRAQRLDEIVRIAPIDRPPLNRHPPT